MPNITGRDQLIIAQALALALEALTRRQHDDSNMDDMEMLLAHYGGAHASLWRTEARAKLSRSGVLGVQSLVGTIIPFPGRDQP
jgi:hypothetical protein